MLFVEIAGILALIAVNGFLAMSELALVSSRRSRLRELVEQGVRGSRRALALAADPGRFLSTVQIGITLVGILAGAISGATIGFRLAAWLESQGFSGALAEPVAIVLVVTAITYVSLIAGELVPKRLALRDPEQVACRVAPVLTGLARAAFPFVWLLDVSSRAVLSLIGQHQLPAGKVTEEEIKTLIAEAESAGVVEPEERLMIARVMRLGDRPVRGLMTPLPDVDSINLADDPATIRETIIKSVHSRLPVFDGASDEALGIVQAKDMLGPCLRGENVDFRALVRPAPVIPDSLDALDALISLRASPVHIGLVHDEYGHFEGVVTSADILEAIVGEFRTEEGSPDATIVRRADGSYLVAGSMPVEEFADHLGIALPENRNYHTVAGLVLSLFRRLPAVGETVEGFGCRFEVVDLDGMRIDKVLVTRLTPRRRAL